jgi:hypothetical protein
MPLDPGLRRDDGRERDDEASDGMTLLMAKQVEILWYFSLRINL